MVFREIFGAIEVETPKFQLLKKSKCFEIRKYGQRLTADVYMSEKSMSDNGGFRYLANYIFGANSEKKEIAMTAPVITTAGHMKFILPSEFKKVDELPTPNDPLVEIKEEDEMIVAVLTFTGYISDDIVSEKEKELKNYVEEDGEYMVLPNTLPHLARYNPPWTIPFWRTNELMIEVEPVSE